MSGAPKPHTDIRSDAWVDRLLPAGLRPYARLARLDRPIGIWLLLLPCWWSIALASPAGQWPDWRLMALFGLGAVVMRGAGCTINDILDRDLDAQVERTRGRPLPSGAVTLTQALLFLVVQLLLGLLVLLLLPPLAVQLGIASLLLVATYPLMKRVTWWPQAFLGLTFNWGALMGWAAVTGTLFDASARPAWLLYIAGFFWTLGYDTIYAHQDREDDARIGVKSTALRLGTKSKGWVQIFYFVAVVMWGNALLLRTPELPVAVLAAILVPLALAASLALRQPREWRPDDPASSLAAFHAARLLGWLILVAAIADRKADLTTLPPVS